MKIIDPYPEMNRRMLKRMRSLSQEEASALMKEIGILDKRGHLAPGYRDQEEPEAPKTAKPRSRKKTRAPRRATS